MRNTGMKVFIIGDGSHAQPWLLPFPENS